MILTLRENPCVKGVHMVFSVTFFSWLHWLLPHRQGRGNFFVGGSVVMETRVAVISIIVENPDMVQTLNGLLHEYSEFIIGRMGIPYPKRNVSIITVALDAPQNTISTLSGKLGGLSGVSVKTAYSSVTGKSE